MGDAVRMIRPARFTDITRITELVLEMHGRSRYAEVDEVDTKAVRSLLMQSIQRHGLKSPGGTCVFVDEPSDKIEGFVVGALDRLYHIGHKLMATDVFLYASERADLWAWSRLMDALAEWAAANPNVVELWSGVSDAIGDWHRTERLYQRKGMSQIGVIYERKLS